MRSYSTINSFSQKPSLAQILSYLVFTTEIIINYAVLFPIFDQRLAFTILIVLYTLSLVFLVISTLLSSLVDPSDQVMVQFTTGNRDKISHLINQCLYCDYCRSYVKAQSRHCRTCMRCVQNFDHHCMWINNCVGSLNYKYFAIMIVSTWCNLALFLVSVVIVVTRFKQFLVRAIVGIIVGIIVAILWFLLSNLILLHIYLNCKGLSTYQFLTLQKNQQQKMKQVQIMKKLGDVNSQNKEKNKQVDPNRKFQLSNNLQIKDRIQDEQTNNKVKIDGRQQNEGQIGSFNEVVFGEREPTQKSQGKMSSGKNEPQFKQQQEQQSVKLSQFFTRNKSLKIILGNSHVQKPNKSFAQHNSISLEPLHLQAENKLIKVLNKKK